MSIQRYSVMPLSNNSGVIGWVPECDTLHSLVKQYREPRNIKLNCEHKLMMSAAPNYDSLPTLNKVEIFEMARNKTRGEDLAKMQFLRSQNSEIWLSKRTNYTRSVAITSMAGYILGLGDRHPNNLMIDRVSGKVVHIDFGDCWEVCQTRSKFPESVPFRLTRMMVKAMEVSGIEGSYRSDCETVMRILRDNRDSLTAMLEAFVHDPLISWRLLVDNNADVGGDVGGEEDDEDDDDDDEEGDGEEKEEKEEALIGVVEENLTAGAKKVAQRRASGKKKDRRGSAMNILNMLSNKMKEEDEEEGGDEAAAEEVEINSKAIEVKNRIDEKLTGFDFNTKNSLTVEVQVDKLIKAATNVENLAVLFAGWSSWW